MQLHIQRAGGFLEQAGELQFGGAHRRVGHVVDQPDMQRAAIGRRGRRPARISRLHYCCRRRHSAALRALTAARGGGSKRLGDVGDDVVLVLDADGKPDGFRRDAGLASARLPASGDGWWKRDGRPAILASPILTSRLISFRAS